MNKSLTTITGLLSSTTQVKSSFCLILYINLQCVLRLVLMVSCCCVFYHCMDHFYNPGCPRDGTCPFSLRLTCMYRYHVVVLVHPKSVFLSQHKAPLHGPLVQPPLTPMTGLPRTRSGTYMKCVWLYVVQPPLTPR